MTLSWQNIFRENPKVDQKKDKEASQCRHHPWEGYRSKPRWSSTSRRMIHSRALTRWLSENLPHCTEVQIIWKKIKEPHHKDSSIRSTQFPRRWFRNVISFSSSSSPILILLICLPRILNPPRKLLFTRQPIAFLLPKIPVNQPVNQPVKGTSDVRFFNFSPGCWTFLYSWERRKRCW